MCMVCSFSLSQHTCTCTHIHTHTTHTHTHTHACTHTHTHEHTHVHTNKHTHTHTHTLTHSQSTQEEFANCDSSSSGEANSVGECHGLAQEFTYPITENSEGVMDFRVGTTVYFASESSPHKQIQNTDFA